MFDGVTGDHADHNNELLDDQDWEDFPDDGNSLPPKHPYMLRLNQKLVTVLLHAPSKLQCSLGKKKQKNLPTFNPLISKSVLKMDTADNVAGFGLQLTHLKKKIFQRDGDDELLNTFI